MKKLPSIISLLIIIFSYFIVIEEFSGRLNIGPDQTAQYVAAQQIALGNGLVRPEYNPNDISQVILKPHSEFPPGLAYITAPLFMIFNDIHTIHVLFSLINLLIFSALLIYFLKILYHKYLSLPQYALIVLFMSINAHFLQQSGSADLICLDLIIIATIFVLKYLEKKSNFKYLVYASLALAFTVYLRYAFMPALVILPSFFLWRIVFHQKKEFKELALTTLSIILISAPFLLHIYHINTQTSYVVNIATKNSSYFSHIENIIAYFSFPISSYFSEIQILKILGFTSTEGYDRGYDYPFIIHLFFCFISFVLIIPIGLYMKYKSFNTKNKKLEIAFQFLLIASIILSSLLLLLITRQEINNYWTIAKIYRYFIVPIFLIQLIYLFMAIQPTNKWLKWFAILVFTSSFMFSLTFKIYNSIFNYKLFHFNHNTAILRNNDALLNSFLLHKTIPLCKEGNCAAIIDENISSAIFKPNHFLGLNNIGVALCDSAFDISLKTSQKTTIYFIADKNNEQSSPKYQTLIEKYKPLDFTVINHSLKVQSLILMPNAE